MASTFDGFFLDTLDSYQTAVEEEQWLKQEQALIEIIRSLSKNFPNSKIILNRGFTIIKEVHALIHGVTAESLYAEWDPLEKKYSTVKKKDRDWLLKKLTFIKNEYDLPISIVDYLPPSKRVKAREVAAKIAAHGFVPWVSTPELDYLGLGQLEVIPRKILMLYNSANQSFEDIAFTSVHKLAEVPLEYLGYVPVYYDIKESLPNGIIKGRYAGIVAWFDGEALNLNYQSWIYKQISHGVKIAFMGGFGFDVDNEVLIKLNLKRVEKRISYLEKIEFADSFLGFESKPL